MTNQLLKYKLELAVNKIASLDYGNIEPAAQLVSFNKGMDAWTRRQLEGINQTKTGAEGSTRRIDDLQCILTTWTGLFTDKGLYWQSDLFPADYLEWCRIDAMAQDECKTCPPRILTIFEGTEADATVCLIDQNRQPSYAWATTFSTLMSNTFKIWTNDQFDIVNPLVTYYRKPRHIQFVGLVNPDDNTIALADVECEFPDGVTELMIDEAAAILVGDLNDYQRQQSLTQRVELDT